MHISVTGLQPKLQCLDNEVSHAFQEYLHHEGVNFQLVPPHLHQCNAAKRAIHMFKNHFIVGLCSADKDFPIHLWDHLIPQAELMLNLIRGLHLDPTILAWAQLHGSFDFNCMPIALPGMHVLIHKKSVVRGTWAPHAIDGWYLGPALQSYWCYIVWSKDTHTQCICDTLTWLPATTPVPEASTANYILAGISNIANALHKLAPNSPIAPLTDSQVSTSEQLMVILHWPNKGSHKLPSKEQSNHESPLRVGLAMQ